MASKISLAHIGWGARVRGSERKITPLYPFIFPFASSQPLSHSSHKMSSCLVPETCNNKKRDLNMNSSIFHLSIPVTDIESTKEFYVLGLGCGMGRQSSVAMTLDFHGHQIVAHVTQDLGPPQASIYPRHFGLVCQSEREWTEWRDRAQANRLRFFRESCRRFAGTPLEHLSFFLQDPSHNLLEFKYYFNPNAIFGEQSFSQIGDDHEREVSVG